MFKVFLVVRDSWKVRASLGPSLIKSELQATSVGL